MEKRIILMLGMFIMAFLNIPIGAMYIFIGKELIGTLYFVITHMYLLGMYLINAMNNEGE